MSSMAATAPAPMGSNSSFTTSVARVGAKADALALSIGSRIGVGSILLACVLVILVGAQSMLGTLQGMDRDIKVMNEQLGVANAGLVVLNKTMDSLPPTSKHLSGVVATVKSTTTEVDTSKRAIGGLSKTTKGLNGKIGHIATSTSAMRGSLEEVGAGTGTLNATVGDLNVKVAPLVATQHDMYLETKRMGGGLDGMNASIAYVIRQLNYMTSPPTGMDFSIRATMLKETLPPIPGLKTEVDPIPVFPRGAWPVYAGP